MTKMTLSADTLEFPWDNLSKTTQSLDFSASQEQFIRGQSLSPGIAIGVLYPFESELEDIEHINSIDVKGWFRLLEKTRLQLEKQIKKKHLESIEQSILASHLEILKDPTFTQEVQVFLEEELSLKDALEKSLNGWKQKFKETKSVLFQERLFDLQDVVLRLMKTAHRRRKRKKDTDSICLYTRQALPSSILEFPREKLSAVICESGSIGSHLAILARSRKLPCLSRVRLPARCAPTPVIVDANEGWLILNPSEPTWSRYSQRIGQKIEPTAGLKGFELPSVRLWATVNSWQDVHDLPKEVVEGIGLVRTEFFAYEQGSLPSFKNQVQLYTRLSKSQKGKNVAFRLFDFGSDKPLLNRQMAPESNPALGCRGIRLLLKEHQILKDQLKALLIASQESPVSIVVPMVSLPQEMRHLKKIVSSIAKELKLSKLPQIGMMVEIPAAAFMLEQFVDESDFFSIGTNDLLQYMYAVDRVNQHVSDLYNPLAPPVLHLIDHVVKTCKRHFRPVSVCGEMAADPACILALSRLGVADYSLSPSALKRIHASSKP